MNKNCQQNDLKINTNGLKWLKMSKNDIEWHFFVLISRHGSTAVLISIVDAIQ